MQLLIAAIAALSIILPAAARDNGQWVNSPADIRQRFQSLMLPDNPAVACCGEAGAFDGHAFGGERNHYAAAIPS
jgi:hypothetical protein